MDEIVDRIKLLPEEQVSAWREAHGTGSDEPLSLRWETSHMWTPEHRDAVATAISDWALEQSDAREALRTIARADRRVGVWLACACARTALRYVPADDESPRLAIETAERWVRGLATQDECKRAADAADAADAAAYDAADYAAAAARAAASAASAYAAAYAAATYVAAAHANANTWTVARYSALRSLWQTIALATRDAVDATAEGYARSAR